MTSISQQQSISSQNPSSAIPSVASLQSPSFTGGTSSPQPSAAGRSHAGATRKQGAVANAGGPAHGRADSVSNINAKSSIPPAVPTFGGPTIVNGNNAVSSNSYQGDHTRKASVTISTSGTVGQMPTIAGKPTVGNPIQFGSMNSGQSPSISHSTPFSGPSANSLAVSSHANPRVTSPQTSPSPIPQPASSGGRPPSSLHGQNNGLSFGSIGGDGSSRQPGSGMSSSSLTPNIQPSHLRRESSQSSHNDMASGGMGPNSNRNAYPPQGGRGKGYPQQFPQQQQQIPYSPGASYRTAPNAPRAGQGMSSPFTNQGGRSLASPFPNSPHQAARSPSLANSQPIIPQSGQMPIQSPQMGQIPGSPYGAYAQHMGPQVNPQFSSASSQGRFLQERATRSASPQFTEPFALPNTLSPESGQFEQFLMKKEMQGQLMPPNYADPSYGFFSPYGMPQGMQMQPYNTGVPPSPRPPYHQPQGPQGPQGHSQYMPGHYPPNQMTRTPSGAQERPASTVGHPQTPMTPAPSQQPSTARTANSPAPKSSNFQIPVRKGGIVIKDPSSGAVKTFDKPPQSPAPVASSKSPANTSAASTPPPPAAAQKDSQHQHSRTDSQSAKSNAEKVNEMREAVARKIKADEEEEKRRKEKEEAEGQRLKEEEEEEQRLKKEEGERKARQDTEAKAVEEAQQKENAAATETKDDAPKAPKAPKAPQPADDEKVQAAAPSVSADLPGKEVDAGISKPEPKSEKATEPEVDEDSDEYWARVEAEELREEQEIEERYQAKKKAEAAEKERREAEAAARQDEELKKAEREAEALEEARIKKLESASGDGKERTNLFEGLKKSENAFQATRAPPTNTPPTADTPTSRAATPVSEDSSMGPPTRAPATSVKQKPAALKLKTQEQVEAPQPSAALQSLRSARFLTTINDRTYPPAINSPNPALNSAAPMGKFRYDKGFLMQFQTVFVEKPSETWTEKVKETVGDTSDTPGSARPRQGGVGMPPRSASTRGSVLPGGGPFGGTFGSFQQPVGRTLPPGTNSQERYAMSLRADSKGTTGTLRYNPIAPGSFPMGSSQPLSRTASTNSLNHPQSPRNNPSQRGSRSGKAGKRESEKDAKTMPLTAGLDVKPIEISATGWKPRSIGTTAAAGPPPGGDSGYLAPDVVQRKVKAALNKMTPTTFDKISGQILDIVAQSKKETDGRTLRQVIQLTFEKATDEAHWAQMYAEFCSRMLQNMTSEIKDETLGLDKNGNVNAGGTLFRKYLLNRCQQDFEAGWKAKLPEKPEGNAEEAVMLSDEYYIAAAAKRRGLGLVRFIGELYKLGMLTSRIMHMCVKRLVDFEGIPDEAEVESLTSLLKTIGESLDSEEKARPSMDAYFSRINDMIQVEGLPSRLRFMLMDIVELRRKGWRSKAAVKGPATIEEVRAQALAAEREKEAQRAADSSRRGGGGGGRMGLGRGDARNFSGNNQMMPPPSQNTVGMDDLRRLGRGGSRQPSTQGTMPSFGPTSMFNTRGSNTRRPLVPGLLGRGGDDSGASSRTATPPAQKKDKEDKEAATHVNAFSALAGLDSGETNDGTTSPPSTSPPVTHARTLLERQRSKSPLKGDGDAGS